MGEPRLGNVNQIHDEILKKLESMAHTRQRDTKIGRYPIPYCCELETLQQMYTAQLDPTLLEGVVSTTAAPELFSSTTASEPPESTAPVPEKKITLDEYNHRKALKLQQTVASPNLDENGERLDYDDFEPDDDPDNIQIDYQTPAPSLALSPKTSIPLLEDAPMPMSPATTQSQVSTGPGSVPSTMEHTPTAANRAPGFGRGLPVRRTMPIQVGVPQDSTSPMQVGRPQSVFTTADIFPRPADNTNARGTTMPDNNSNVDFHFNNADKAVDADILI